MQRKQRKGLTGITNSYFVTQQNNRFWEVRQSQDVGYFTQIFIPCIKRTRRKIFGDISSTLPPPPNLFELRQYR